MGVREKVSASCSGGFGDPLAKVRRRKSSKLPANGQT